MTFSCTYSVINPMSECFSPRKLVRRSWRVDLKLLRRQANMSHFCILVSCSMKILSYSTNLRSRSRGKSNLIYIYHASNKVLNLPLFPRPTRNFAANSVKYPGIRYAKQHTPSVPLLYFTLPKTLPISPSSNLTSGFNPANFQMPSSSFLYLISITAWPWPFANTSLPLLP